MAYSPALTHTDRAARQSRIADAISKGMSTGEAALTFGLSRGHVCAVAAIYGVSNPRGRPSRSVRT